VKRERKQIMKSNNTNDLKKLATEGERPMPNDENNINAEGDSFLPFKECMETHKVEFVADILWGLGYDKESEDTLRELICETLEDHKVEMEITCPKCREELESRKEESRSYVSQICFDTHKLSIEKREKRIAARRKRQAEVIAKGDGFVKDDLPW
jgi:hypothetical protein